MMRSLRVGMVLVCLGLAHPASSQNPNLTVDYGPLQPMTVGEYPLALSVTGWDPPGFVQAWRQAGSIAGDAVITRYEGRFAHGPYFGRVMFVDSRREVRWRQPTPQDSLRDWPYFKDKAHAFGRTGAVANGKVTFDLVHVRVDETEPKACVLFTAAHELVQLRGYACAVQPWPLGAGGTLTRAPGAPGRPNLFEPIAVSLPVIRASTGPGGQNVATGAAFDARAMPFVSDSARSKLTRLYGSAAEPKALAVNVNGETGYSVGQTTEKEAIRRALERCAFEAHSPCLLYAVGNRVVFQHDALAPDTAVAAAPSATPRPPGGAAGGGTTPLSTPQLVAQLEKAAVLVVSTSRKGTAVGSGFFIAPDRLLTNRHVVEGADRVIVTSRALGRPFSARVIAATDRGKAGSADYALLEVPGVNHEQLQLTTQVAKLQDVVAAGYPGITIGNDADFTSLAQGKRDAAPDLVLTPGEINAIQINQSPWPTLAHTALISQGNSGGPLVDRCGRVVGINSYLISQTTVTGFAIAASDLIDFLGRHGLRPPTNNAPCAG